MHLSSVYKTWITSKALYKAWDSDILRQPVPCWDGLSQMTSASVASSLEIHTAGAQACLYVSQLPHFETSWLWLCNTQGDCFVAGASWRGQLLNQTYLHYNYNPAISGFGWGPTTCVNIAHIQTWAESMMSQVFAPLLILNWECLGVWRRWKRASCFQAVLRGWRSKCTNRDVTVREGLSKPSLVVLHAWKSFFSVRTFWAGPHSVDLGSLQGLK